MNKYVIVISKAKHSGWGWIPKICVHPTYGSLYGKVIFDIHFLKWHIYCCDPYEE